VQLLHLHQGWFVVAKANRFRLIAGADALADYQWAPPGRSPTEIGEPIREPRRQARATGAPLGGA